MPMKSLSQRVTIGTAGSAGTASFRVSGFVVNVFVEPFGTAAHGACNAGVYDAWNNPRTIVTPEALGTASLSELWAKEDDGSFAMEDNRDLQVRFDSGTGDDVWVAHVDYYTSEW